jgi:putative transposase
VPVAFLCQYFKVSRSGFYSSQKEAYSAQQQKLEKRKQIIKMFFEHFKGRYGSPRLAIHLKTIGESISENTIAKVMREQGLFARKKRKFKVVSLKEETRKDAHERHYLIEDQKELKINEVWAGDITYIPVNNKFLYLSVVMDIKRRKVLGWSLDETLSSEGVIKAFKSACRIEGETASTFHSDQGVQYKSLNFNKLLIKKGVQGSMSRRGNCYDNAFVETFFKTLKSELIWNQDFRDEGHLKKEIFEFIEVWYNRKRIHTSLDNKSPLEYELGIKAA